MTVKQLIDDEIKIHKAALVLADENRKDLLKQMIRTLQKIKRALDKEGV